MLTQRKFEYDFNCIERKYLEGKLYLCIFNETKGEYDGVEHYHKIVGVKQHYSGSIYGYKGISLVEGLSEKYFVEDGPGDTYDVIGTIHDTDSNEKEKG